MGPRARSQDFRAGRILRSVLDAYEKAGASPCSIVEAAQAAAQAHGDHAAEAGAVTNIAATGTGESGTVAPCGHVPPHLSRVGEEPLLRVRFP